MSLTKIVSKLDVQFVVSWGVLKVMMYVSCFIIAVSLETLESEPCLSSKKRRKIHFERLCHLLGPLRGQFTRVNYSAQTSKY